MTTAADAFAILGVPPRLKQDAADLERRYFALNRELHPDRTDDPDRERALARAADLNAAYRAVKDPLPRAKTWLALRGVRLESARSSAPSAIAMRGFELQEAAEALAAGDRSAADALRALAADADRDRTSALARLAAAADEEPAEALDEAHPFVRRVIDVVAELNYLSRQAGQAAAALEEA